MSIQSMSIIIDHDVAINLKRFCEIFGELDEVHEVLRIGKDIYKYDQELMSYVIFL